MHKHKSDTESTIHIETKPINIFYVMLKKSFIHKPTGLFPDKYDKIILYVRPKKDRRKGFLI